MTYVVVARWVAEPGRQADVAAALRKLAGRSREEPGCLRYVPLRSHDDDRVFLLYEEYVDEDAYRAHTESERFAHHALGEGIPNLERREREFYAPLEDAPR